MPFIRHSRDKRGYESLLVMHAYRSGGHDAGRSRVLYLYRSPAHLKVGRRPLEAEVMDALESTHPDLSFDWTSLQKDAVVGRSDPPEPAGRPTSYRGSRPSPRPAPPPPPAPPPVQVPADDTPLGRTLGAVEAARLRQRYRELQQRVERRARTPEDRDRLIARLVRLNPDDWTDESAVRSGARAAESEWGAISADLPSRRRGRRGGRRRGQASDDDTPSARVVPAGSADGKAPEEDRPAMAGGPSGIMDGGDEVHAGQDRTHLDRPNRDADGGGDRDPLGGSAPSPTADADLPVDD